MRRVHVFVASFAVAAAVACSIGVGAASAANGFSYTFPSDNQGWRSGDGTGTSNGLTLIPAVWVSGAIQVTDSNGQHSDFFESPSALAGDYSSNFGGTLSVDVKSTMTWANGFSIVLYGSALPQPLCVGSTTNPTATPHTYSFTLNSSDVFVADSTGACATPATDAQVAEVLSTLQAIIINAEDVPGSVGTTTIDNVNLSGGTAPPPKQTLTIAKPGSGSGTVTSDVTGISCGTTCSASLYQGLAVTLTESPAAGSTFTGWSGGGCSGTATTCHLTLGADTTVTATFSGPTPPNALTVIKTGTGSGTVTSSPAGISCGATCSGSFAAGSMVTLTAAASPDSAFAGWAGACSGAGACTVTMSAAKSVAATFNTAAPPKPKPPNTTISFAGIDSSAGDATFKFSASGKSTGFQCALVQKHKKAKFTRCKSPKKYKKLKRGKYTFEVRAVGPGGPDPSPAKSSFKIK